MGVRLRRRWRRSARPGRLGDVALLDQGGQHPRKALLGNAENAKEIGDAHARLAGDEMKRPMMGPPEFQLLKHLISRVGEIPIGKEEHVLRKAELLLSQKEQARTRI